MAKKNKLYVTKLDLSLADRLKHELQTRGLSFSQPSYTLFQARKPGLTCTLYTSGKLVIQGKDSPDFIHFYLEPELLKVLGSEEQPEDLHPRIGVDEAGKGDFFGALCVAAFYASAEDLPKLKQMGVRDSKKISDKQLLEISKKLRTQFPFYIIKLLPQKYNELYGKFKNLNRLLAWCHATSIEKMVQKTNCQVVILDKFADDSLVLRELAYKKLSLDLTQRTRGEEDLVVAAASILARGAFLETLQELGARFDFTLPKGASAQVIKAGKNFVEEHGLELLGQVAKLHFKTLDAIVIPPS